ncbi:hypothetical protein [Xanthobacter wiegelii]|uniref:hypothetical protein n=1 Tax=Xanthobacter wiegelii TaxID=3119913 RepID=UPI0037268820
MVEKDAPDVGDVEFDAFLNALKETSFDAAASSKAYHHSAVDPAEWQAIMGRLQANKDQCKS